MKLKKTPTCSRVLPSYWGQTIECLCPYASASRPCPRPVFLLEVGDLVMLH